MADAMPDDATLMISRRFNGPPDSANGGYACGLAARGLPGPPGRTAAVTLHRPPPLDTALTLRPVGRRAHLWAGEELLATVAETEAPALRVAPVAPREAAGTAAAFRRQTAGHPFPTCFVCGHDRAEGDGLRLAPGAVPARPGTVACVWEPGAGLAGADGRVPAEIVWSALDCPGGWADDPAADPKVLIWMAATIAEPLAVGRAYVVAGTVVGHQGSTTSVGTALFDEDGGVLAHAAARWMSVRGLGFALDRADG